VFPARTGKHRDMKNSGGRGEKLPNVSEHPQRQVSEGWDVG